MRRVYGRKVTRITQGGLPSRTGRNPGAGEVGLNGPFPHVRQKSAETIVVVLTKR